MHKDFRKLLNKARGVSEFPIVMNIDIREFTKWTGDSAESGLFIKRTYIRIIDDYLAGAAFYKATGDGLLVVFPVDEDEPKRAVRAAVDLAIKLVRKFPTLTLGDPMVNFATPKSIGIGLARGPASKLISGRKTLDYSGATLNLASRLMELARPKGIVLDGAFGWELLTPSMAKKFKADRVYPAGIAPKEGIPVYYSADWTEIPASAKVPLEEKKWGGGALEGTRKELEEIPGTFSINLDSTPASPSDIRCYVQQDARTKGGRRSKTAQWRRRFLADSAFEYQDSPEGPKLVVKMSEVRDHLEQLGSGPTWPTKIRAEFIAL